MKQVPLTQPYDPDNRSKGYFHPSVISIHYLDIPLVSSNFSISEQVYPASEVRAWEQRLVNCDKEPQQVAVANEYKVKCIAERVLFVHNNIIVPFTYHITITSLYL